MPLFPMGVKNIMAGWRVVSTSGSWREAAAGGDGHPERRPYPQGVGSVSPLVDSDVTLCDNDTCMAGTSRPATRRLEERLETRNPQEEPHERHETECGTC
jgi:hypothetical protein